MTVLCPLGVRASLSKWKVRVPHFVYWGEREYKSHMKQVVVIFFSTLRAESSYSPPEVLLQGIFSRPPRLKKIIYKKNTQKNEKTNPKQNNEKRKKKTNNEKNPDGFSLYQ